VGNGTVLNGGLVLTPEKVGGDLKWKSIVSAVFLTCGVAVDDDAYCWGGNAAGERGDGTFDSSYAPLPRKVIGGLKFRSVSADWHVCGVTTDQRAYCWAPASTAHSVTERCAVGTARRRWPASPEQVPLAGAAPIPPRHSAAVAPLATNSRPCILPRDPCRPDNRSR